MFSFQQGIFFLNLKHGFSCLLSSGDTDAVVPVTATRYSIDALKLPTVTNWHPWYDNGKVSTPKEIVVDIFNLNMHFIS